MFYSTSMAASVVGVVGFVFIRETYTPVLLKQRQHHVSCEETSGSNTSKSLATRLRLASFRPLQFFVTEYIVMVVAIYMACSLWGIVHPSLHISQSLDRRIRREPWHWCSKLHLSWPWLCTRLPDQRLYLKKVQVLGFSLSSKLHSKYNLCTHLMKFCKLSETNKYP